MRAKLSGDPILLDASGIPRFEEQLLSFLLTEKSSEFLRRMCDRTRQFLSELPQPAELGGLIGQIDALSRQLDRNQNVSTNSVSMPAVAFGDLHGLPSCEICANVAEKLWKFLCSYQYEITISQDEQQRFADRGGLCPFHTWQLQSVSSPYGTCVGHAPLLDRLAGALRHAASTPRLEQIQAQLQNLHSNEHDCVLCNVRNRTEQEAIVAAARRLERESARALNALSAVCLPHFIMLVSAVRDEDLARKMLQRQATVLERYAEDMKRYAIKHAGVRRDLASDEESAAAERGLLLVAGRRQVNFAARAPSADGTHSSFIPRCTRADVLPEEPHFCKRLEP